MHIPSFHSSLFLSSYYIHDIVLNSTKYLEKAMAPTPVLLPGKSHGRRSLVGCSPWGRYELDRAERLHFHFSLWHIWEGNGNPLQCSCLGNPRDGGAWWAAVSGVTQSRTRLKRLSSSSNTKYYQIFTVFVSIHLSINKANYKPYVTLFIWSNWEGKTYTQ